MQSLMLVALAIFPGLAPWLPEVICGEVHEGHTASAQLV
jgi:hypothetical protein